jgi:diacylglycerol O-acyltransferase
MYWNGARLDGTYPLSIVTDGMAMNITLVTNDQSVDFGIIACRRSMRYAQRLIDYMEDALRELEDAAGIKPGTAAKSPKAKRSTRKRPTAKTTRKEGARRTRRTAGSGA